MVAVDVDCMACIANLALATGRPLDKGTILDQAAGVTHAACGLYVQRIKYRACELEWDSRMAYWRLVNAVPVFE